MVDRLVLLVGLFASAMLGASIATAQRAQGAETGVTKVIHLHLSAEAAVSVPPDVLVADLGASSTSASAASAQRAVNTLMLRGLNEAKGITGVDARAMHYSVDPVDLDGSGVPVVRPASRRPGWTAQQTLELRSAVGEQLLDLVGKLQNQGFTVGSLDWQLSPALGRKARDVAMVEALKALQARAAAAASTLGLRVDYLQDVRVDMPEMFPPRPMMQMAANMGPPPSATASAQDVSSQVSADVVLQP